MPWRWILQPLDEAALSLALRARSAAKGVVPRYSHARSPRTYDQHQLFALAVLRRWLGAHYRPLARLLHDRADVREALGLGRIPHYSTLCYAETRLLVDPGARALLSRLLTEAEASAVRRTPGDRGTRAEAFARTFPGIGYPAYGGPVVHSAPSAM